MFELYKDKTMLSATIKNFPKARLKIILDDGREIFVYAKHTSGKQTRLLVEAPEEVKLRREYNKDQDTGSMNKKTQWEEKRARSNKGTVQKYMQIQQEHNE